MGLIIPTEDIHEWLQCVRFGEKDAVEHILSKVYPLLKKELIFSTGPSYGHSTALHMAAANNHTDCPKEQHVLLSKQNASGNTALHWAVVNGHRDAILALLQRNSEKDSNTRSFDSILNIKNNSGRTVLDEAQLTGRDEISEILLKFSI